MKTSSSAELSDLARDSRPFVCRRRRFWRSNARLKFFSRNKSASHCAASDQRRPVVFCNHQSRDGSKNQLKARNSAHYDKLRTVESASSRFNSSTSQFELRNPKLILPLTGPVQCLVYYYCPVYFYCAQYTIIMSSILLLCSVYYYCVQYTIIVFSIL